MENDLFTTFIISGTFVFTLIGAVIITYEKITEMFKRKEIKKNFY